MTCKQMRVFRVSFGPVPAWTFLTNHAHVLLCIARDPAARLRDVAEVVGITERAAQRIVAELEEAGYLTRTRDGRRNRYELHPSVPLRHPLEREHPIGELLDVLRPVRPPG
jgi:DNA-binding transcriptional ArsR family regulator